MSAPGRKQCRLLGRMSVGCCSDGSCAGACQAIAPGQGGKEGGEVREEGAGMAWDDTCLCACVCLHMTCSSNVYRCMGSETGLLSGRLCTSLRSAARAAMCATFSQKHLPVCS